MKNINIKIQPKFSVSFSSSFFIILALAYFIYPQWTGVFGIMVFMFGLSLTLLFSLIPFAGFVVQPVVAYHWIVPAVFNMTGIWSSPLTIVLWIMITIVGYIICFFISLITLVGLKELSR